MSRLDDLVSARDFMWASLQETDAEKRGPLMNQWRALEATIAELESRLGASGDPVDEIAARRAARGGATARPRGAGKRSG